MKKRLLVSLMFLFGCVEAEVMEGEGETSLAPLNATVTVVYDNVSLNSRYRTGFGFGCVVETPEKKILFDTGGDSPTLLYNMEQAGIDPAEIDMVVLSHIHGDHTGGLMGFLGKANHPIVFVPASFQGGEGFKSRIREKAKLVEVSGPTEVCEGVLSTGELGASIKEQSLVVKTNKGIIVVTGCAHPGIVPIVHKAKEVTSEEVYLVMGGFHLGGASESELGEIISAFREMEVQKAAPSHCTGDAARQAFREEYNEDFVESGAGAIIRA